MSTPLATLYVYGDSYSGKVYQGRHAIRTNTILLVQTLPTVIEKPMGLFGANVLQRDGDYSYKVMLWLEAIPVKLPVLHLLVSKWIDTPVQ
jgi:hypothetical protein